MTNRKPSPQLAEIQLPLGSYDVVACCPICGQATAKLRGETYKVTACPHLAFIYIDLEDSFEYQSPDFAKRLAAVMAKDEDFDFAADVRKSLQKAGYGNQFLALSIAAGCGPSSSTGIHGFDYGTLKSE